MLEAEVDFGDLPHAMIGLIARPAPRPDDEAIAAAVGAARDADVAVVVVGLTVEQETESRDKATLALPGAQDALVEAVAAVARRTVVVVNAATPVLMPWLDRVDAVLVAGLPGQEGGHAVASALLGSLEPSGRLVTTWPAADGATPAWSVTPDDGALPYVEGGFLGYRGTPRAAPRTALLVRRRPRLRPLGLRRRRRGRRRRGTRRHGVPANTGDLPSREVVQVYFAPDRRDPGRAAGRLGRGGRRPRRQHRSRCAAIRGRSAGGTPRRGPGPRSVTGELLIARGLGDIRLRVPLS